MIYFSAAEILLAMLSFFGLGFLFGGVYNCERYLFYFFKNFILSPKTAYISYKNKNNTKEKPKQSKRNQNITVQLFDFVFILFFGVCYILFSYLYLDGSFRFFSLIFLALGYLLSMKVFSAFFSLAVCKISNRVLHIYEKIVYLILQSKMSLPL